MSPYREHISNELHKLRVMAAVIGVVLFVAVCAAGWTNEYRSCKRAEPVRELTKVTQASNDRLATLWTRRGRPAVAAEFRTRVRAAQEVRPIHCLRLLPEA